MNIGKTLFAQLMDFLPWSTFARIVARYGGDARVRTLCCAEQYRAMAFAQLTYRESLRDIEVCLSARASKLYHIGFREPVRRSTLADANETRDWRIYAEFAHRLIAQARKLYANESLGMELANTVYALDSTTIDLCLSLFPWAHFRSTKAAVKMHTLLDLRGNIPSLQAARRSRSRFADPRSRRHLRHGSRLRRLRAPLRLASGWLAQCRPVTPSGCCATLICRAGLRDWSITIAPALRGWRLHSIGFSQGRRLLGGRAARSNGPKRACRSRWRAASPICRCSRRRPRPHPSIRSRSAGNLEQQVRSCPPVGQLERFLRS